MSNFTINTGNYGTLFTNAMIKYKSWFVLPKNEYLTFQNYFVGEIDPKLILHS